MARSISIFLALVSLFLAPAVQAASINVENPGSNLHCWVTIYATTSLGAGESCWGSPCVSPVCTITRSATGQYVTSGYMGWNGAKWTFNWYSLGSPNTSYTVVCVYDYKGTDQQHHTTSGSNSFTTLNGYMVVGQTASVTAPGTNSSYPPGAIITVQSHHTWNFNRNDDCGNYVRGIAMYHNSTDPTGSTHDGSINWTLPLQVGNVGSWLDLSDQHQASLPSGGYTANAYTIISGTGGASDTHPFTITTGG